MKSIFFWLKVMDYLIHNIVTSVKLKIENLFFSLSDKYLK